MKPLILALILTGGTAMAAEQQGGPVAATLRDPGGRTIARATVGEMHGGLHVRIDASGMAQGDYGAHLHTVGRCDGPAFESAGGHWNPAGRQHGTLNSQGHHAGDLPNLEIGADGRGRIDFHAPNATLRGTNGALDADGTAVVIHAGPDDYRTDPSGNSGARIACGVLR
jgi:Cu-Zn family superoxide dismutase